MESEDYASDIDDNGKCVIGDIDFITNPVSECHDIEDLRLCLANIEYRLGKIERALKHPSIIKASPIVSLIYMDKTSTRRINNIYDNWINYMTFISRCNRNGIQIDDLFWIIDRFIFEHFFFNAMQSKHVYFVPPFQRYNVIRSIFR